MNNQKLLSIVTTYNPHFDHLDTFIKNVDTLANQFNYHFEVIVIDDFDQERSKENLLDTTSVKTKIIHHTKRVGQTASLVEGVSIAQGSKIIVMDSDMIINIPDILRFVTAGEKFNLVLGNRINRKTESPARYLFSTIISRLFSKFHNNKVNDYSTPMFLIDAETIKPLQTSKVNPRAAKLQMINACKHSKCEIDIIIETGPHKSNYSTFSLLVLAIKELIHILTSPSSRK